MSQHKQWCRHKAFPHTDAAKRTSDQFNLHRLADQYGAIGKWFAAALHDGSSDGVLYDTKQECVRHQHHNEQFYTYIKIIPSMMTECEAEVMLSVSRRAYDNGMRMADPDAKHGGKQLIRRTNAEDMLNLSDGFASNLALPGRDF